MYILLTITVQKIKSKIELQRWLFRDVNLYFMTILTAVLFLKRRLLKIAKSPVLRTCGNDNSKSRYGNDLKFVMDFKIGSSSSSHRGLALTK